MQKETFCIECKYHVYVGLLDRPRMWQWLTLSKIKHQSLIEARRYSCSYIVPYVLCAAQEFTTHSYDGGGFGYDTNIDMAKLECSNLNAGACKNFERITDPREPIVKYKDLVRCCSCKYSAQSSTSDYPWEIIEKHSLVCKHRNDADKIIHTNYITGAKSVSYPQVWCYSKNHNNGCTDYTARVFTGMGNSSIFARIKNWFK